MKRINFVMTLIVLAQCTFGQQQGLQFDESESWKQVLQKARGENKYIFVDCYATWCGPCKEMEKNVYLQPNVGNYFNSRFINVKVQFDTSARDNELTKKWYPDAKNIIERSNVGAFPTYLFFSPDGEIVHRAAGYMEAEKFVQLGEDALNPSKQYYSRIKAYNNGVILPESELRNLAYQAKYAGDMDESKRIAKTYIANLDDTLIAKHETIYFLSDIGGRDTSWLRSIADPYLNELTVGERATRQNIFFTLAIAKDESLAEQMTNDFIDRLAEDTLYTPDVIDFLSNTVKSTHGKAFKLLYNNQARIDKVMQQKNFSEWTIDALIAKDNVWNHLIPNLNVENYQPKWEQMSKTIANKYGAAYARRVIIKTKAAWYQYKENWPEFTKSKIKELEVTNGLGLSGLVTNNACWDIFKHSDNKRELLRAAYWMEQLFKAHPEELQSSVTVDTYANLLYKAGKKDDAIRLETEAAEIENKSAEPNQEIISNLEKMKKGLKTWP